MKKFICLLFCLLISVVTVAAESESSGDISPDLEDEATTVTVQEEFTYENIILDNEEIGEAVEYSLILNQPVATYLVNSDDIVSDASVYALNSDVYQGSYNSTIVTMWEGLVSNNIGKDYVCWRGGQYDYYMFIGEDFSYENGVFSGSGRCYHTSTYSNTYGYEISEDSFSVRVNGNYVYSNLTGDYPALSNERGLVYDEVLSVALIGLAGLIICKWIFTGR